MTNQEDIKDLHAKLKRDLCEYIDSDINESQFDEVKKRVEFIIKPKGVKDAVNMQCFLDVMEKKDALEVGKYDTLKKIFLEFDARIVRDVIEPAEENIKRVLNLKLTKQNNGMPKS